MNSFFENLKHFYPINITQDEWYSALQDEEFLEDDILTSCFQCMDDKGTELITGNETVFSYIENQVKRTDIYHAHYLRFAKDWLYCYGIYEESSSLEATQMKAIVCKNCGGILGFIINNNHYYPYLGYLDDRDIILQDFENNEVVFRDYGMNYFQRENVKIKENNILNKLKENLKEKELYLNYEKKKDLIYKLDNNKNKMQIMLDQKNPDMNRILPVLKDTFQTLQDLNDVLNKTK